MYWMNSTLPEGQMTVVFPWAETLFGRVDGSIYAISANALTWRAQLFAGRLIMVITITCPCHDWRFDIRTESFWTI